MTLEEYLTFLGFPEGRNPFASVNARDERGVLEGYFVAPPYFETLWGNPAEPQSAIILAPTGAGKTALAVVIDERAAELPPIGDGRLPVLTVLYDDFSRLGLSPESQDLAAHLSAINYLLVINLLLTIGREPIPHFVVSDDERAIIRHCFAKYAGGKAPAQIFQDLQRISTPWERFQRLARKVVDVIPVVSLLAKGLEIGVERLQEGVELVRAITNFGRDTRNLNATPETDFHRLVAILNRFYQAIYVLVDRVDETPWTQRDPEATYRLVHPLVGNLNLLDYPERTFGFKFFLWDGVDEFYKEHARPDRIFSQYLLWKPEQLIEMINRRVRAFSNNQVKSVAELFADSLSFVGVMEIQDVLALFAGISPRAMVTLCRYMVEEQVNEINHGNLALGPVGEAAFVAGLKRYANDVAYRLIPNERARQEITSINRIVFTTKSLNSDIFRGHSPEAVRSKVGKWKKLDVFSTIGGELSGKQGFPTEIHAFSNASIALLAVDLPLRSFLQDKVRRCQNCGLVLLRDFDKGGNFQCKECLSSFELPRATTEEHESRQAAIRSLARDVAKIISAPEDIRTLCRAAHVPLADGSYLGQPFVIWLRVLQYLEENDRRGLHELLELLDETLPHDSRAKKESLPELYYGLGD